MRKSNKYIYPALLVICTIAALFPVLGNDFQYYWDDQWMVMNHYTEGGLNFRNLWAILSEFYHGQYAPTNEYMFTFIYAAVGYNPFWFHLASLLLHIGCVLLTYVIIIRIFSQTNRAKTEHIHSIAFIASLLFAIHPMNVESVAWISAVKILNYSFYYLIATYIYLAYLENKKIWYYIAALLLMAVSFGGKEQALVFPVWLILLYWILGYSLRDRKIWLHVAPFFILSVALGIVYMSAQATAGIGMLSEAASYPVWQRFVLGSYSFFEYIAKFLFPYKLLYVYPFPIQMGEPLHDWMLIYPALIAIIAATLWKYLTKTPVLIGLLFFMIHIAIVLHIVPISRYAIIADRYIYLSSIGLSFIIAYYFVGFFHRNKGNLRIIATGTLVTVFLYLGAYSNLRSREWKDSKSIKRDLREIIKQRDDFDGKGYEKYMEE
jgi:hypothetical protein